ncbi:MAG: CvpA family protein [Lachnospiraceae bacterium]|nr:CvpA family protein [Lachnospiraceae bacterium]
MNKNRRFASALVRILISAFIIFLLFYTMLPAINPKSQDFFLFLILSILIILSVNFLAYMKEFLTGLGNRSLRLERDPVTGRFRFGMRQADGENTPLRSLAAPLKYGFGIIALLIVFMTAANLIGIQFFNATRYRDLILIDSGDFSEDVAEISMSQIPVVDRDTATRLGSRKLGEMSELVSQFEIETNYTQINYKGIPYRVTPLSYADPIKWLYNQKKGLPAYIMVNMVTQQTELVWLDSGMKYSPSEYFFRNIYRHLRFRYPTKMFETVSFEIDDEGTPYWVAPTISYRIGWWSGKDIGGAILVNAITGESAYYDKEDVPQWIDQLYDSDLIIAQLDDNGRFQNGYINSVFGQKNVRRTTYGYNYLALDDDVYLYTGMSSVTGDQSNIGFVLVNLRTKATRFYTVPGATETSAMASAQGQVQHLKYSATFPLLLNISDRPTYFVSLKDDAGLVKMYAFVDVEQYQIVGTGQTIDEARKNYRTALNLEDVEIGEPFDVLEKAGVVDSLASVVVGGNTVYYFTLKGEDTVYAAAVTVHERLPFLQAGDRISFTCTEEDTPKTVTEIKELP